MTRLTKKDKVDNKWICIGCGIEVPRRTKRCQDCHKKFLKIRPTYIRTTDHKTRMHEATAGKKKSYPSASTKPEVAAKIHDWWTPERKELARQRGLKFALDPKWRLKIALSVSGEKNPRWEDGRACIPYSPGFANKVHEIVHERDDSKCQICGSTRNLCVHHIDFQKDNHDPANLQVVCRKCHSILHVKHRNLRC